MRWHPDKNKDSEEATEKFKEISEAYRILSDPNLRRDYDRSNPKESRRNRDNSEGGTHKDSRKGSHSAHYSTQSKENKNHYENKSPEQNSKNRNQRDSDILSQMRLKARIIDIIRIKFGPKVVQDFVYVTNNSSFKSPRLDSADARVIIKGIEQVHSSFDKLYQVFGYDNFRTFITKFLSSHLSEDDLSSADQIAISTTDLCVSQGQLQRSALEILKNNFENQISESDDSFNETDFFSIIRKIRVISPNGKIQMESATDSEKSLLEDLKRKLGEDGRKNLLEKYKDQDLSREDLIGLQKRFDESSTFNSQSSRKPNFHKSFFRSATSRNQETEKKQ